MCGHLEDTIKLPLFNNLEFPSSSMSVACLYLSLENQKGGCIKQKQIILNTAFHEWHLYCL